MTGRIRFAEGLSPDLQGKVTADAIADNREQLLLAYANGKFKAHCLWASRPMRKR